MIFRSFGSDEIIFSIQDFRCVMHSEQKTKAFWSTENQITVRTWSNRAYVLVTSRWFQGGG